MEKRSKFALKADKNLKAMGAGERTSKKVSTIRKADGSSFKRRNANQFVDAGQAGGNEYTEKRVNRTDKFNTGGTADSAENGGANIGGTLGSSMMKKGGKLIGKQKNLDLNKNGKLDSQDFKMLRGKKGNGGGTGVSSQTGFAEGTNADLLMNKDYLAYANGGGLANVPESFPETDAMSYKKGGAIKAELEEYGILDEMSAYDSFEDFYKEFKNYKKNAFEQYGEEVEDLSKKYSKEQLKKVWDSENKKANGGSTKGFEYSIGGL